MIRRALRRLRCLFKGHRLRNSRTYADKQKCVRCGHYETFMP